MKFSMNRSHQNFRQRLILFTRYPEPGRTKTRLIPCLGPEGAADLQRRMTERLLNTARRYSTGCSCGLEIRYEGGTRDRMADWLGPGLTFAPQGGGGLDRRMGRALEEAFAAGMEQAVITGTDIPGIDTGILRKAFEALADHELVLGPAADGGYYLIGMRENCATQAIPAIFSNIPWGTGAVLTKTLESAEAAGLRVALTEVLQDVDRPEDLAVWEEAAGRAVEGLGSRRISVVIPTLNEAGTIASAIDGAREAFDVDVIVVDGGSRDRTVEIAWSHGATVFLSPPPRARQLNLGAARAKGSILLFLHADTRLPRGYAQAVRQTLEDQNVAAGAFALAIDSPGISLRIMERVANLRSRYLHLPYGDQAFFMRSSLFHELNGFPEIPIMEDFQMVRRLAKKGKVIIVDAPVTTSSRRWLQVGVWKTWGINQLSVAAFFLGVSPERIASFYRRDG